MLLSVACNNKKDEEFITNLSAVYDSILAVQPDQKAEEIVLFPETNEELLESYYPGLADIQVREKSIYMHPVGYACEIALVEVEKLEDVEKVKAIFEKRIEKGKTAMMCDAESQDIWNRRAEIQSRGRYVGLIVLPDDFVIPKDIFMEELKGKQSLESENVDVEVENEKESGTTVVGYKKAFSEELERLPVKSENSEYVLYDIDSDDMPEMIVKTGDSEADTQISIYDFIGDTLVETPIKEFGGHTVFVGVSVINTILFQYGQNNYEIDGILHYNSDATYTIEKIRDEELGEGMNYIPFEPLKTYSFDDKSGLEWIRNPDDENYWYINAGNEES